MSVITVGDQPASARIGPAQRPGFWRRLTQALDAYLAERTRRAVPAGTLRRSRRELARCRRLIRRAHTMPGETVFGAPLVSARPK
jgi:hypothetical protein